MAKTLIPGQAGGRAVVRYYGKEYMREIGLRGASKGGRAVVRKYGNEYMSLIGTLGANAVNGHLSPSRQLRTERAARRIVREANAE